MKLLKYIFLASIFAALTLSGYANAASETATMEFDLKPNSGSTLYKEAYRPVNLSLQTNIEAPPASPRIMPLKKISIHFPNELKFSPGNTPVCKAVTEQSNLAAGTEAIIQLCPKAVVGSGTAKIYLAKVHLPQALISDPELTAFYNGTTSKGVALKIYGYSRTTNVGVLMAGILDNKTKVMDINVPVLSNDSAVTEFKLDIPGTKGKLKSFAHAKCSTNSWSSQADMTLGERSYPGGQDIGSESYISTPEFNRACTGATGSAAIGGLVKGASTVRGGKTQKYSVVVRNPGTATLKNIKVSVTGKWLKAKPATTANISPGGSRTVKIAVKTLRSAKAKQTTVLKVRIAGNAKAKVLTKKLRVK